MTLNKVKPGDPQRASWANEVVEKVQGLKNAKVSGGLVSYMEGLFIDISQGEAPSETVVRCKMGDRTVSDENYVRPYSVVQFQDWSPIRDDSPFPNTVGFPVSAGVSKIGITGGFVGNNLPGPIIHTGVAPVAYEKPSLFLRRKTGVQMEQLRPGDSLGTRTEFLDEFPYPADSFAAIPDLEGPMSVLHVFHDDELEGMLTNSGWLFEYYGLALVHIGNMERGAPILITDDDQFFRACHTLLFGDGLRIANSGNGWVEIERT